MKKGGTRRTKVPPKPPFEPQGTPTRSQREPKMVTRGTKEPKGSPQGVKGTPREDKIAHRRSKIAETYENTMVFSLLFKVPACAHFENVHLT